MKKTNILNRIIVLALFIFYMYGIVRIILFKFRWRDMDFLMHQLERNFGNIDILINHLQRGNFIPFKTIFININNLSGWHDLSNLLGNIVAFIPFGIFLIFLYKNKGITFKGVLALSLSLSLCLESLQVIFTIGSFDVDDLILNTLGGLLGYCAFKIYFKSRVNMPSIDQKRDVVQK